MKNSDYEYLLKSWKELVDNLIEVNDSLRSLCESQHITIQRLQGTQTIPPTEATQERKES